MKKILCLLLCMVMLLSLFAGCKKKSGNDEEHKHTYATEWSFDDTSHWYQANCEHSNLQANYGEHIDEDLDGCCDVCSHDFSGCTHTFAAAWSSDETYHWHNAVCAHIGAKADQAEHSDENNDGACDACEYTGDHEHTYSEEYTFNDTQHWNEASCGHDVTNEPVDHEDLNIDGCCDTCGHDYSGCEHTFSEEFSADVTYHWFGATCEHTGAMSERELHEDADEDDHCDVCGYKMCKHEDFDMDGECDKCGGPLDPEHVHEFGETLGSGVDGHWFIADCHPGAVTELEEHIDENNDGQCDICQFQICGHSFAVTWTSNETHHWHAILCTCSIPRKDYAEHVDNDGDGGCDICMYGVPIESCYEVIIKDQPFTLVEGEGMITYAAVSITFPQAGKYVITPSNLDVRVWETNDNTFNNTGSSLTVEISSACTKTYYFRYFDFSATPGKEIHFTYCVTRMDDMVIETLQGKVELPANTRYTLVFKAPEVGTYKLITGVDGLVIGLTEDTMEYFKGHIEFTVKNKGDVIYFYIEYNDETVSSFIFDWQLVEPFCLDVGEGNYSVDVTPGQIDYKIEFTAPEAGYYLLSVNSEWLTFCAMGDTYNEPVRLEVTQVLTPYMEAGQVYTTWLQTVYNYPASTNVYDTLTVSNVGKLLYVGNNSVTTADAGSRYSFQSQADYYYRITVTGGQLGIIAPNGTVSWTENSYEVYLEAGYTFVFMAKGGNVSVKIESVNYSVNLFNGYNAPTLEPNKHYKVNFYYLPGDGTSTAMDGNSIISLTWVGTLYVYVNGEEYTQGTQLTVMNTDMTIMVKSNGATTAQITVNLIDNANDRPIEGVSETEMVLNQTVIMAVNRDGDGAKATFTAETGGTYTLTVYSEKAMVYVVAADGGKTLVISGGGAYSFNLDAGSTVEFYFQTTDNSAQSISAVVAAGR